MSRSARLAAVAAGLLPLVLGAPAALAQSGTAVAPAGHVTAASGVKATISVTTSVRTAYAGKYGKFGVSFRCERGRYFDLLGYVEQDGKDGDPLALAFGDEDSPTGTCTGHMQRRTVYVAAAALPDGQPFPAAGGFTATPGDGGEVKPLRTGPGYAGAALITSATRRGDMRFDAMTSSLVRVHPR